MTFGKRIFDLSLATLLGILALPLIALVSLLVLARDGCPIFYFSERMKSSDVGFTLVKFRTMQCVKTDCGVSGGDKTDRITRTGAMLRRTRLDEVPQLWNVLRGDMSFVGPRPPLREYVEQFPDLYAQVLRSRPGITGLATVRYYRHEERCLSRSRTREETDQIYIRTCVPRKARLDLIYQRNRTLCFDIRIMLETILPVLK